MPAPKFASVDEYLAAVPTERRQGTDELRSAVRAVLPDAEEVVSYQILGYRQQGRVVIWLAAYADHYSLHPATGVLRQRLGAELEPYLSGKGTIRFEADESLPLDLVRRIVEVRAEETD